MSRTTAQVEPGTTIFQSRSLPQRAALLLTMVRDLQDEVLAKPEPDQHLLDEFEHVSRSYLLTASR